MDANTVPFTGLCDLAGSARWFWRGRWREKTRLGVEKVVNLKVKGQRVTPCKIVEQEVGKRDWTKLALSTTRGGRAADPGERGLCKPTTALHPGPIPAPPRCGKRPTCLEGAGARAGSGDLALQRCQLICCGGCGGACKTGSDASQVLAHSALSAAAASLGRIC